MDRFEFNFKAERSEVKKTSDYLDKLVRDYRVGAEGSSEALLEAFMPLISKYYRLLTSGIWDIDDTDVTGFLRMLGTSDIEQTVERLVKALKCYEPADLYQELVLILFKTAKRYLNISANFKYVAKAEVKTLISDPLVYQSLCLLKNEPKQAVEHEIDQAWVNGLTAGDGWDTLTSLERAVIKSVYYDKLGEAVAAKKLHMSVRQLRNHKKAGKDKLAKYFKL